MLLNQKTYLTKCDKKGQKEKEQNIKGNTKQKTRKNKCQYWSFWNRYNFVHAGRETVNQAAKDAPDIIKAATNDVNKIAEQIINQTISQGGKELERVELKILRDAIADVY